MAANESPTATPHAILIKTKYKRHKMTNSLKHLNAQIEQAEPGSSEMVLLLEAVQELSERAESTEWYDPKSRASMCEYLRKNPFYQGVDLDAMTITSLRKWCAEVAIEKIRKDERVREHHDEERLGGLE